MGLDKSFHRGVMEKGLKLCLVERYLLVDKNTHQPFLYLPQRPDTVLLELSFLLFLLCIRSAIAFCSGWLEGHNGREKSGKRDTVGRNWGIKGRITGICPQFLDMLKSLLQQCHLVPCLHLFGRDHFKSLEKESTSGTSLGLCRESHCCHGNSHRKLSCQCSVCTVYLLVWPFC